MPEAAKAVGATWLGMIWFADRPVADDRLLSEIRIVAALGWGRRAVQPRGAPIRADPDLRGLGNAPGFVEVNFVAHSGTSAAGVFVQTMVLIDIATSWTECLGPCAPTCLSLKS